MTTVFTDGVYKKKVSQNTRRIETIVHYYVRYWLHIGRITQICLIQCSDKPLSSLEHQFSKFLPLKSSDWPFSNHKLDLKLYEDTERFITPMCTYHLHEVYESRCEVEVEAPLTGAVVIGEGMMIVVESLAQSNNTHSHVLNRPYGLIIRLHAIPI